ncbi:MAG TPA: glycoside hydrolase family 1 protein [Patescibacteria group bacterium]|nr:glycoside hydrolase family 1 protein [Patescibacteria group bacterium]
MAEIKRLVFPPGFLWGTATAAHQVEGNNIHSDWWEWEQAGGGTEPSGQACGQYELFSKDFNLIKKLHNNAHRLSLEWARLEPKCGWFDPQEVKHYRKVLSSLKKRGIKTFVTLHHFTNPSWFAQKGGFVKRANLQYFEKYVSYCAKNFGDLVDAWITINEPNMYVGAAYLQGLWPPQKRSLWLSLKVMLNLALAHRRAYQILHQKFTDCQVGAAVSYQSIHPTRKKLINRLLCWVVKFFSNNFFYFLTGKTHDFLGLNYYQNVKISWRIFKLFLSSSEEKIEEEQDDYFSGETTDLGWNIYPRGIHEVVVEAYRKYRKPIFITENGVADSKDTRRKDFIQDHLRWLYEAIKEGIDVRGYFYWTLLDNFEWALGFKPKFGLAKTDYSTLRRNFRPSARFYAEVCQNNAILDL